MDRGHQRVLADASPEPEQRPGIALLRVARGDGAEEVVIHGLQFCRRAVEVDAEACAAGR